MNTVFRLRWVVAGALILGFAVAFGVWLFVHGGQGVFFDAQGYYELGVGIATGGLGSFSSDFRTYVYPLFVSLGWLLSERDPSSTRFVVFVLQLGIYLAVCLYGTNAIHSLFRDQRLAFAFLALTALNPLLLIYTTELLSDLLSAVLIFLAVLVATRLPSEVTGTGKANSIRSLAWGFASGALAGTAAIVRPANALVVGAVAVIWTLRWVLFRQVTPSALVAGVGGLILPFVPQMYLNAVAFGTAHPLIVSNLYSYQTEMGVRLLKYGTLVLPGKMGGLLYTNPFLPESVATLGDLAVKSPVALLVTLVLHLFGMFDQALPFAYVVDPFPIYRWPLTAANFAFLFVALLGIGVWTRQVYKRKALQRADLLFVGMLIAGITYIPAYLPTAVESRFGLPEYLLAAPFGVLGLSQLQEWIAARANRHLLATAFALSVFLLGTGYASAWLERQAPVLDPSALPDYGYIATRRQIDARFGPSLELHDAIVKSPQTMRGGDRLFLVLGWRCNGASIDNFDIQVELVDPRGHVFAQGLGHGGANISPCPSRWWEPNAEQGEAMTLEPSPVTPPGRYRILLSVYDRTANRYAPLTLNAETNEASSVVIAEVEILKNKASHTASELAIEQPFFVDMREIRLLGFVPPTATIRPGETLPVALYWRARGRPQGDYAVTVQLRDANGVVVSEQSSRPADGQYPTTVWSVGEVLLDWHDLPIPNALAAGEYEVVVLLREGDEGDVLGQAPVSTVAVIQ